jgi:hypothetical protein
MDSAYPVAPVLQTQEKARSITQAAGISKITARAFEEAPFLTESS